MFSVWGWLWNVTLLEFRILRHFEYVEQIFSSFFSMNTFQDDDEDIFESSTMKALMTSFWLLSSSGFHPKTSSMMRSTWNFRYDFEASLDIVWEALHYLQFIDKWEPLECFLRNFSSQSACKDVATFCKSPHWVYLQKTWIILENFTLQKQKTFYRSKTCPMQTYFELFLRKVSTKANLSLQKVSVEPKNLHLNSLANRDS